MNAKMLVTLRGYDLPTDIANSSLARGTLEFVAKILILEELGVAVGASAYFSLGHGFLHFVHTFFAIQSVRILDGRLHFLFGFGRKEIPHVQSSGGHVR